MSAEALDAARKALLALEKATEATDALRESGVRYSKHVDRLGKECTVFISVNHNRETHEVVLKLSEFHGTDEDAIEETAKLVLESFPREPLCAVLHATCRIKLTADGYTCWLTRDGVTARVDREPTAQEAYAAAEKAFFALQTWNCVVT